MSRSRLAASVGTQIVRALILLVVLTLLWGVLADNAGWGFGMIIVAAATLTGLIFARPDPHWRWSPVGLLRFLCYFVVHSLAGGLDVARRALDPALPLEPDMVHHPLRVPPGPARTLFVGTVSLLPGTLSVDLDGDTLIVHCLSAGVADKLPRLEARIAALFAIAMHPPVEERDHA